jgi:hypothetical protein
MIDVRSSKPVPYVAPHLFGELAKTEVLLLHFFHFIGAVLFDSYAFF